MKKNRSNRHVKQIVSLLIALCLMLSFSSITAFAGEADTVYRHTYHTKVKRTVTITVQDSEGNTLSTYPLSEESNGFIEGNISDDAVQAELDRIDQVISAQFPTGDIAAHSKKTSLSFDHFESRTLYIDVNGNPVDEAVIKNKANELKEANGALSDDEAFAQACKELQLKSQYSLDIHEYQIYEINESYTIVTNDTSQDNYVIDNVIINNAPAVCTVGEAPKAQAEKGDNGAYTFYEYWEEWAQTENGLEPVKFWYSDAEQMSRVPENQKIITFEEGKTYSYSIIAKSNENYTFVSKDALSVMLNGDDFTDKSEVILDGKSLMIGPGAFMTPIKPVEPKEIEQIEINNATVSFKAGDKPVFTGTTAENALYAIDYEGWFGADNEFISSSEYWNNAFVERGWCDGSITSFKANTEYSYQLYLKLTDEAVAQGYVFGPNTKLKVNGNDVDYPHVATGIVLQIGTDLTMTPTAADVPDYRIIEGANGTWTQNSDGTLTFRANGDFSKFTEVQIDDTPIDAKNYTAVSGSTVITLKNDYLKALSVGTHTLTVVYTNGECSTDFEIASNQIDTIEITNIETPVRMETMTFSAEVPDDANYEIDYSDDYEGVFWAYSDEPMDTLNKADDSDWAPKGLTCHFVNDYYYMAVINLKPKAGYEFAAEEALHVTMNGKPATFVDIDTVEEGGDGTLYVYLDFGKLHTHSFQWVIDKEATSTENGSKHEECEICGYSKPAVEIPATGTANNSSQSPRTGDNSHMMVWFAVLFISGAGVLGTTVYRRRKKLCK